MNNNISLKKYISELSQFLLAGGQCLKLIARITGEIIVREKLFSSLDILNFINSHIIIILHSSELLRSG